jgi:hypothetical protein
MLLCRAHLRNALHPNGQLRELLAGQFKIADDDSTQLARDKFERELAPLFADKGPTPVQCWAS